MTSYFAESGLVWERPYDSQYRWKEIGQRDAMTAADRLQQIKLNSMQRGFLVSLLEAMAHCPIEQASYVEMLRSVRPQSQQLGDRGRRAQPLQDA